MSMRFSLSEMLCKIRILESHTRPPVFGALGSIGYSGSAAIFEVESSSIQYYALQALNTIEGPQVNEVLTYIANNPRIFSHANLGCEVVGGTKCHG